jgi:hypothetical protein
LSFFELFRESGNLMSGDGNRGRYMMRGNLGESSWNVADVVTDVFARTGNLEDE